MVFLLFFFFLIYFFHSPENYLVSKIEFKSFVESFLSIAAGFDLCISLAPPFYSQNTTVFILPLKGWLELSHVYTRLCGLIGVLIGCSECLLICLLMMSSLNEDVRGHPIYFINRIHFSDNWREMTVQRLCSLSAHKHLCQNGPCNLLPTHQRKQNMGKQIQQTALQELLEIGVFDFFRDE